MTSFPSNSSLSLPLISPPHPHSLSKFSLTYLHTPMASKSFQPLHHPCLRRRHSIDYTPSTVFLKPTTATTTNPSLSSHSFPTISFSLSSSSSSTTSTTTTIPSTSNEPVSLELLRRHLAAQDFRQADEETRRLLIVLAGEQAQKRGYVFFSEVQFIPENALKTIDDLWRNHSGGKFGFKTQKKIFNKSGEDFTKFFIKIGWMKKLETEVEQYNYRAFPNEFIWELNEETPEGHLPLTNALRGTQLLNMILNHPAFEDDDEEEDDEDDEVGEEIKGVQINGSKSLNKRVFKSDYSF